MIWVEGKTFLNETVKLDFTRWRNCTFLKCKIIVKEGEFDLMGCDFKECKFVAEGGASTVLKLFSIAFPTLPLMTKRGSSVQNQKWLNKALNWFNEANPEGVKKWVYTVLLKTKEEKLPSEK